MFSTDSQPGMTRRVYRCPSCHTLTELAVPLSLTIPSLSCPVCFQEGMTRYFGEDRPTINYGYRESHYATETDARIAQYQFTNL